MSLLGQNAVLALGPAPQPGQSGPAAWTSLVPLILLVVVFYFALIRPQQRKQKEHAALLKTVRKGDEIVTNSGIIGEIITVREKTLTIRSADSKFEITKGAVAEITKRSGESDD